MRKEQTKKNLYSRVNQRGTVPKDGMVQVGEGGQRGCWQQVVMGIAWSEVDGWDGIGGGYEHQTSVGAEEALVITVGWDVAVGRGGTGEEGGTVGCWWQGFVANDG